MSIPNAWILLLLIVMLPLRILLATILCYIMNATAVLVVYVPDQSALGRLRI